MLTLNSAISLSKSHHRFTTPSSLQDPNLSNKTQIRRIQAYHQPSSSSSSLTTNNNKPISLTSESQKIKSHNFNQIHGYPFRFSSKPISQIIRTAASSDAASEIEPPKPQSFKLAIISGLWYFQNIVFNIYNKKVYNKQRDPSMNALRVDIDEEHNNISVYNNGDGVSVEIHQEEGVYVPELIFGHLLTSSNYDDNERKTTSGRNGYGAKLTSPPLFD